MAAQAKAARNPFPVMAAQAAIHASLTNATSVQLELLRPRLGLSPERELALAWIPAYAGMTVEWKHAQALAVYIHAILLRCNVRRVANRRRSAPISSECPTNHRGCRSGRGGQRCPSSPKDLALAKLYFTGRLLLVGPG
jgi:hypothetical protein